MTQKPFFLQATDLNGGKLILSVQDGKLSVFAQDDSGLTIDLKFGGQEAAKLLGSIKRALEGQ